jgi:DNA gyrase/topoisomerase IV subunit A
VASGKDSGGQEVNLEAAARLVAALEQDLRKVTGDSSDLQRLRDEVETLKNVLNSPVRRQHWVRDGLHSIRESFSNVMDEATTDMLKGGQYVAEIGRILGL